MVSICNKLIFIAITAIAIGFGFEPVPPEESEHGGVVVDVVGGSKSYETTRFLRQELVPVLEKYGHKIIVNFHPYGPYGKTHCSNKGPFNSNSCTCQHGKDECMKNYLQACVMQHVSNTTLQIRTVTCVQGRTEFYGIIKACIGGTLPNKVGRIILECAKGSEGPKLMYEHGEEARATVSNDVTYVPWIAFNKQRSIPAEYNLERVICNKLPKPPPLTCPR